MRSIRQRFMRHYPGSSIVVVAVLALGFVCGDRAFAQSGAGERWVGTWMTAISGTIYAGASEIQRNILAESVLGLPKEPRP